jgi:hypothetical protein
MDSKTQLRQDPVDVDDNQKSSCSTGRDHDGIRRDAHGIVTEGVESLCRGGGRGMANRKTNRRAIKIGGFRGM